MTEDDTFRILSRPLKEEMRRLVETTFLTSEVWSLDYVEYIKAKEEFLLSHGWTLYEYNNGKKSI